MLAARVGYCEPSCTLCGQVCPTGAIAEFTSWEKDWVGTPFGDARPIRLGTAFYNRGRLGTLDFEKVRPRFVTL